MTGRSNSRSTATRGQKTMQVAALATAAVLAALGAVSSVARPSGVTGAPASSWRAWRRAPVHPAETADHDLAALRRLLPAADVVGYLCPFSSEQFMAQEPELQRFFATQYALVPSVLRLVYLPECAQRGTWACGLERLSFLLVPEGSAQGLPGFEPIGSAGGTSLLSRRHP